MAEDDVCAAIAIPIEDAIDHEEWSSLLDIPEYPSNFGTESTPASELFYVGVNPKSKCFGPDGKCEVYGSVELHDEDGTSYVLYSTDSDHTQTLTPQHNLLYLNLPRKSVFSTWSHISYWLQADNGCILQNKRLRFDKLTDINQYHQLRHLRDDYVFLSYAFYPAAVVADLEFTLNKRNNTDAVPLNLSGRIIARCGNTYCYKYPAIVLHPPNELIELTSDGSIELYRFTVVVPAYSFLRIDLRLSQPQQEEVICRADFRAKKQFTDCHDFETKDFDVQFQVSWRHQYELLNKNKISGKLHLHEVIGREPSLPKKKGYSLVEVYSVMIHQDTESELKILGSMMFYDNASSFSLFNKKNEYDPFEVLGKNGNTIPINVTRRCFEMSGYVGMTLKLRDVENRVRIHGYFKWDDCSVVRHVSWYDKRICSVFNGIHGYAAAFYTIFSEALQAEVSITLKCDTYPNDSHCVSGSVLATHNKESYLTEHDRAYYQSVLFRDKPSLLKSGDKLALVKSVVAVPIDASLKLDVNLVASPLSLVLPEETLKKELKVPFYKDLVTYPVKGTNYRIEVTIVWSDLDQIFTEEWDKKRNLCNIL